MGLMPSDLPVTRGRRVHHASLTGSSDKLQRLRGPQLTLPVFRKVLKVIMSGAQAAEVHLERNLKKRNQCKFLFTPFKASCLATPRPAGIGKGSSTGCENSRDSPPSQSPGRWDGNWQITKEKGENFRSWGRGVKGAILNPPPTVTIINDSRYWSFLYNCKIPRIYS